MSLTAVPLSCILALFLAGFYISRIQAATLNVNMNFIFFLLWLTRCLSTLDLPVALSENFYFLSTFSLPMRRRPPKKHVDPSPEQIVIIIKISSLLSSFASFISQQELQTGEIESEREMRVRKSKIQKCLRMIREFAIKLFIRLQRDERYIKWNVRTHLHRARLTLFFYSEREQFPHFFLFHYQSTE